MLARVQEEREAIQSVLQKLESGEYALEETRCFCGGNNDKEIKQKDRIGIPHRVVVCLDCGLARANPRMTADSYRRFYNEEYRKFIYRWLDEEPTSHQHEAELIRQVEYRHGQAIQRHCVDEDLTFPKVVVDIGCYYGGVLDLFQEQGCKTYGVEFNDEAREACDKRHYACFHSIEALAHWLDESNEKPDFIIMQDVVEHFTDLRDMEAIKELMGPETVLYVFTPGMFRTDPRNFWQLAHTYYFVANTLLWTMEEMGFQPTYIDEDCTSFWIKREGAAKYAPPPAEWAEYIMDEAEGKEERKLPPFRGVCKFTKKLLYDNMKRNYALGVPDIAALVGSKSGPIVVIGGGPSIDGQIDEIKRLQREGIPVICIARMYPWCVKNLIIPDYVVSLDCSEEQEKGFQYLSDTTTHLMSAVTRPEIVEKIVAKGAPCYLFDSRDDRRIKQMRREAGYQNMVVINSGGTVVITCIAAAFTMGYDELHIFGFDCMFPSTDQFHAKGIAGESVEQRVQVVEIAGKNYMTTPSFIEFARQALDLFSVGHNCGFLKAVHIYGESLIQKLWPDLTWHDDQEAA